MGLSNWPDYLLIERANKIDKTWPSLLSKLVTFQEIDNELNLRQPNIAAWYFGDCDGQLIFVPCEPEYDSKGYPIISEMIRYSNDGKEVWIQI